MLNVKKLLTKILNDIKPKAYYGNGSGHNIAAGIDNPTYGASVTVPPGTYVVAARWSFSSTSAAAARIAVGLRNATRGVDYDEAYTRIMTGDSWWASMSTSVICSVDQQTTFRVLAACSVARNGCSSVIRAFRIGGAT